MDNPLAVSTSVPGHLCVGLQICFEDLFGITLQLLSIFGAELCKGFSKPQADIDIENHLCSNHICANCWFTWTYSGNTYFQEQKQFRMYWNWPVLPSHMQVLTVDSPGHIVAIHTFKKNKQLRMPRKWVTLRLFEVFSTFYSVLAVAVLVTHSHFHSFTIVKSWQELRLEVRDLFDDLMSCTEVAAPIVFRVLDNEHVPI